MTHVSYAVEGWIDEAVAEKLIAEIGCIPLKRLAAGGKSKLDPKLPGLNRTAKHEPWLILRDLDSDADCPSDLIRQLLVESPEPGFVVRVPVRSVEAWLLADARSFAAFFRVREGLIPTTPDQLINPKAAVVELCRRSTKPDIRGAMVPKPGGSRAVGEEYAAYMRAFTTEHWSPIHAADHSPSLRRSVDRLTTIRARGIWG